MGEVFVLRVTAAAPGLKSLRHLTLFRLGHCSILSASSNLGDLETFLKLVTDRGPLP